MGTSSSTRRHRILTWIGATVLVLVAGLLVASFFLDGMVRSRTEAAMNASLKGYHVTLEHAHVQLLSGALTLTNLVIIQQQHPRPPVADFPEMRFRIQWGELFSGHVVANVLLWHPRIHVDQTQLVAEKNHKVPMRQEGWQQALETAYPFKINRFMVEDGDVVYIQDAKSPPFHLSNLNLTTDNIRNIHSPGDVYPSWFRATVVIFDTGTAEIEGNANYLLEPFPGARTRFKIKNVPLSVFDAEIRQVNINVAGGRLSARGLVEYSPKITRVEADNATIDRVKIGYVHKTETQQAEAERVKATGNQIEKQNNRRAVEIRVHEFDITNSVFSYTDETKNPQYRLFINDANLEVKNLSNHQEHGQADAALEGKFMGSGEAKVSAAFLASHGGPAFNLKVALQNTDLTLLNDLLRAYGRFDVAAGKVSVFSQIDVKDAEIGGYVKPMFSDLQVYNYAKDKNTGVLHQAKEIVIGGTAHLFKNRSTQQVATQVELKGKLTNPNISTWQAIGEVVKNAFIQAILPGFDRSAGSGIDGNTGK
jgi:hypothetical protein